MSALVVVLRMDMVNLEVDIRCFFFLSFFLRCRVVETFRGGKRLSLFSGGGRRTPGSRGGMLGFFHPRDGEQWVDRLTQFFCLRASRSEVRHHFQAIILSYIENPPFP